MRTRAPITIADVRRTTDNQWDAAWRDCSYATYFHSREWADIWCHYSEGEIKPDPKTIHFSDNHTVILPLSLQQSRIWFGKRFLSSPAGTFGGWLTSEKLDFRHVEQLLRFLRYKLRNVTLRQNPFDPLAQRLPSIVQWTTSDFTQVIDYRVGLNTVHNVLRKQQILRKYKQGVRAGLQLIRVTSPDGVQRYIEIYEACRRRWGAEATSSYGARLFRSLKRESPHIDFWAVEKDGYIIAGGPFFKSGSFHVVSWLAVADPDFLSLKPYEFLYYSLISHYGEAGFRFFDFNPSGGHEGVIKFKRSFGAVKLPANVLSFAPLSQRSAEKVGRRTKNIVETYRHSISSRKNRNNGL